MKKVKGLTKRIAAMLMSGMLIVGAVPGTVLASENEADIGQTSEIAAEVPEGTNAENVSVEAYSEDAPAQEEEAAAQYYTVTLDANGGDFVNEWDDAIGENVEQAEVVEKHIPVDGTVATFPVFTDPDGRSMVFAGWTMERDGELAAQAGEEYAPVDNCVLYAVWEAEDTSVEDPGSQESDEENTDEIDAAQDSGEAVAAEDIQDVQDSGEAVTAEEIQDVQDSGEAVAAEEIQDVQDSGEVEAAEESQSIQDYEEEETSETQSVQDYEEAEAAEESPVDDNPASDADANPENIDENEQAIASDQEAVYEDEDIENSSEKSSDSEVSEEEIQPEQNKSSKEEETVREDAAKGVVESGTCGDHLTWTLNDMGTLTITGTGDMEDYSIFGLDVPWYDSSTTITKVTIGNGVTRIGDRSFQKCSNLTSISIPEGMTSIGDSAFSGCSSLPSVGIPNSVTSIGDSAFSGCSNLPSVGIPNSVTSIGRNAFYGCSSLTSVSIPNSVTSIGDETFSHCGSLTSVVFPNSLTSIGINAFKTCSSLKSVTIPNSVTSIGGWAFAECSSLESVTIPNSVTSIGEKAFHNTPWQNAKGDFSIINGILLEYQGEDTNVIIPEGVTSIGGSAFERCTSLESVTIPEGVRSIGDGAFYECSSLTSVTIPESMTRIEGGAFYGCRSVTDVYYESSKDKWTEVSIGKGNLAFENVIHYVIDKAIITGLSSKTYTGTALIQSPVVTLGGTALSEGIDYTVSYSNNINAGTAIVTITGTGDYMGTITATFMINKAAQSITASDLSLTYLSSGKISVSGNQGALTYKSSDTTIATVNNSGNVTAKGVGTATITITAAATENYMAATKTVTVKVSAATIADFDVTLESTSYTYNGIAKKPAVTIKYGSITLEADTDYTVSYSNNTNAGTAMVTVSGKGNYTGLAVETFTIAKASPVLYFASNSVFKKTTDSAFTNTLTKITDGTVSLSSSNTSVATVNSSSGLVTIKGAGSATITANAAAGTNYNAGSASYSLTVSARSISDCTMTISPTSYTYDGTAKKPTVTIKNNSTNLTINTDYTVSYNNNTNAGTGTVTATGKGSYSGTLSKTFTIGKASPTLSFASSSVSKKTTDSAFTNTLTKKTDGTVTFSSSNTSVATVNSSSGLVTIKGAGKTTITANAAAGTNYNAGSVSYELTITRVYTVTYNANGGTGTPSSQTKLENEALTLSSIKPAKRYTISFNSCGGSVSPASKSVDCTFKNWNTAINGGGTSYASGGNYSANADATLYAQWSNPKAGELATPTRNGYAFAGWYTASSGGNQVTDSSTITGNVTFYAHWKDPYNIGDETYSFENYVDSDSYGHCFGMSITSAGYENKILDIKRIGGNENTPLYSFSDTPIVREPICYYQNKQGNSCTRATVAGGSVYKTGIRNIDSDWQEVVNYVKNHKYDNLGLLQIGFRKDGGGHAINFLRYEYVNGQDRIYAYDNNFPNQETYFYKDEYGRILQAPVQTFNGALDCIALRDSRIYFSIVGGFDSTRALYMSKDDACVQGYNYSLMDGAPSGENLVLYEIPADQERVTIVPNRDYADFIYMDTEFSFGEITDSTRGELIFSSMDEQSGGLDASFIIYEESDSALIPTVTLSKTDFTYNGKVQKPTVTVKVGSTVLTESQDYIVEYPSNMVDVGTYKVKVTLTGNYSGVLYDTFEIVKGAQPIAASNLSLTYAKTGTITTSGNKGKLTYKSDHTSVATVDSAGKVTAKGVGTAKITITAAATENYNAATKQITVTVTKAAQSITASNLSLTYPNSGKITASGNKGALSYKSSNTAIATVDSAGKVTAKGAGKATITITAAATSNYNAATKQITVTVARAAQSITAKAAASSIAVGKTTTVSITGAKGTKSFKSSDTTVAAVNASTGLVTARKVGTVKITATSAATAQYNAASKTVTIKVVPAATASLTAANQATGIKLTWKRVTGANGYKVYRGSTLIKTITSGSTVTYADAKANTNGTKYTYKVVAKASTGDSTLSKSVAVYRVARPAVPSVTNSASKKMTVKWGKNAKANGYQIQYSLSSSFASGNKAVTVASASTVSKVIGSLTKGKTYYVRIRTYKTVGSAKYWSEWSAKKSVKISK